jgi:uncharacterized protein YxjI
MKYPLDVRFKLIAISPQLTVRDADGNTLFYIRQKAFKLRESVHVFADEAQTREVARIKADRIIDLSATYNFEDPQGRSFGAVRRKGMRSFWKAHYEVLSPDGGVMTLREDNAFVKLMDGLFANIPLVGMLSGYVFNPTYTITRGSEPVLRIVKRPAFLESRFEINRLGELDTGEEALSILSVVMMLLLERARG